MPNLIRSLCALVIVAIGTAGCVDLENLTDFNENPNAPTSLAPEYLLPSLIRGLANEIVGESNIDLPSASLFVQHNARIQYAGADRYDLGTDYGAGFWGSFFSLSGDPPNGNLVLAQHMLDGATAAANANETAVAMILKAYAAHNLTDMYGNVPYSQAVQGGKDAAVIRPVYDAQSAIYDDLFVQLTAATAMVNVGTSISGDLVFGGDMDKWRRFGNSLRLRLAMRISEVNAGKAATEAAAAVAAGVMEDASHTAALWYSSAQPDHNPMWQGFVERPGDYRPGYFFIEEMLARNDPRVRFHADPTVDGHGQMFRGMPNGINDDRGFDANGERDFDYVSQVGAWHLRRDAPAFFMEYAETLLLQAEAAERGWIAGSPQGLYEAGITASMAVYADGCAADCGAFVTPAVAAIPQAEITAYLAHAFVIWGGGGASGVETNRSLIYRAYWFQLWDQGLEAMNKYRRTNVPHLIPGQDAYNALVPQRWPYPRSEQTFNETNVLAAITANGGDNAWDKRVWWDVSDQNSGPSN
jgi:hypothetical protein